MSASKITRRTALASGAAITAASCASSPKMTPYVAVSEAASGVFAHGVASGDPAATSVVLWTRIFHEMMSSAPNALTVTWQISATDDFAVTASEGRFTTSAARDWTVKVLAEGLEPGKHYYYRFELGGVYSPVGRTKTLPEGSVDKARFAVMSCSNFPFGYFNVYDLVARHNDLDAVIHLGDYIYEYSRDGYGGDQGRSLGRDHLPANECVTLADYRQRHAQYKADPASQAMHAAHPLIAIWDDHETSNDSWSGGAENHNPETEGDWASRKRAALQAYYEWQPVREPEMAPEAFFRSFSYGDLLTVAALETRLMARAQQFEYSEIIPTLQTPEDVAQFRDVILWDESREMLGAAQLDYLDRTFKTSVAKGQPWRLIANQVIMAKVTAPDLNPHVEEAQIVELEQQWNEARAFVKMSALGLPLNFDAWDGYPAARERFYDLARDAGAGGMIVVTGDTHTWWANDLVDKNGGHMGVELGTHSVTSPSPYRKEFLGGMGAEYALLTNRDNKDVRFLSGEYHGFIDLTITREGARAEYKAVDTIESRNYNGFVHAAFDIARDEGDAVFTDMDGAGFKDRYLYNR